MPAIGYGVFQIPREETEKAVSEALETGYRMVDTASAYFNEKEVGDAIRKSGLKREDIFVTTKLWVQDYEHEDALKAFDRSMETSVWTTSTYICCTNPTTTTTPPGVPWRSCIRKVVCVQSV